MQSEAFYLTLAQVFPTLLVIVMLEITAVLRTGLRAIYRLPKQAVTPAKGIRRLRGSVAEAVARGDRATALFQLNLRWRALGGLLGFVFILGEMFCLNVVMMPDDVVTPARGDWLIYGLLMTLALGAIGIPLHAVNFMISMSEYEVDRQ